MPSIETAKRVVARLGRDHAFPRRLPKEWGGGRFHGSTEGGLKYLRRNPAAIDPELTGLARDYVTPGAAVWDIGANLGLFTAAAAGLAGPAGSVLAVEPDPWLACLLRKAARRNTAAAPVAVLPAAVAAEPGVAGFCVANRSRACSALDGYGNSTTEGVRERVWVPTVTLDGLLDTFPAPDVVKVDVERAEMELLRGAGKILAGVRPVFLIEITNDADAATELFHRHGYRLVDARTRRACDRAAYSTIATPD